MGLSAGATAVVADAPVKKILKELRMQVHNPYLIALIVTIVISIAGVVFAPDILRIMGAEPEVVKEGAVFTRIMLGGSFVIILAIPYQWYFPWCR